MTKNMLRGLDPASILAVCALLGGWGIMVDWRIDSRLAPVKAEQKELKSGQARLERGQALLKTELQKDFQNLENKLDLLLKEKVTALNK